MKFKLSLLDNAYDYLHNSLYYYHLSIGEDYPEDYKRFWRFSLTNIVQCIELIFKEVLRREHEIFIYENIDKPKHTVSINTAIQRLKRLTKMNITEEEESVLKKAIDFRNVVTHYSIDVDVDEFKRIYEVIFEFLYTFHSKAFNFELHEIIHQDYWEEESSLIKEFQKDFVIYNGIEVNKKYPIQIVESQLLPTYNIDGFEFKRIKFSEETGFVNIEGINEFCVGCAVKQGFYHVFGCDNEHCPKCNRQAISCDCRIYEDLDEESSE